MSIPVQPPLFGPADPPTPAPQAAVLPRTCTASQPMPKDYRLDPSAWSHQGAQFVWLADHDAIEIWHCRWCYHFFKLPHIDPSPTTRLGQPAPCSDKE